jgi:hypothetical protein
MTILTIELPDSEVEDVADYVKEVGGKVVSKKSVAEVKKAQMASLEQGLTEAIQISRGEIKGIPFSELWDA